MASVAAYFLSPPKAPKGPKANEDLMIRIVNELRWIHDLFGRDEVEDGIKASGTE